MTTAELDFPHIEAPPMPATMLPAALTFAPPAALVAVAPSIKDTVLAQFKDAETAIVALAEKYRAVAFDVITTKGMAEAVAARADLRDNGKLALTRAETRVKKDVNDLKRVMADKVERLVAIVQPVHDAIDAQIKSELQRKAEEKAARERIEAERVAAHQARLATIAAYLTHCQQPGMTAARIAAGIELLAKVGFGPEWQEFEGRALTAQGKTLDAMNALHAQAVEREAEAARLEAQRLEQKRVAAEQAEAQRRLDARAAEIAAQLKVAADAAAAARAEQMAAMLEQQERDCQAAEARRVEQERVAAEHAEAQRQMREQATALKIEAERVTRVGVMIGEIRAAATGHDGKSAAQLLDSITALHALDVGENVYQEYQPLAEAAKRDSLMALYRLHEEALGREQAAAAPMLQDESRDLILALASAPHVRLHATEAAAAIGARIDAKLANFLNPNPELDASLLAEARVTVSSVASHDVEVAGDVTLALLTALKRLVATLRGTDAGGILWEDDYQSALDQADAAIALADKPEPVNCWYMRDNYTFCPLPLDVEGALAVMREERDAGNTHGMLCGKPDGVVPAPLHAGSAENWPTFEAAARPWLETAVARSKMPNVAIEPAPSTTRLKRTGL